MLRALRVVSVERGHDPRDFALVAFGGAGPLHACALAEELGIATVLVPATAGVLSALGLVASDERRDRVESRLVPLAEAGELPPDGEADLRYLGQSFELTVPLAAGPRWRVPPRARGAVRLRRPGTRAIELVAVRTADVATRPGVRAPAGRSRCSVPGPAVLEQSGSTVLVPPGWVGVRDGSSTLKRDESVTNHPQTVNIQLQVLGEALRAVAEEMGAVLIRSAFSANIKERRDCSTALFDERGRMIAQAEHIPVHLGAMPDAVAAVAAHDPAPGEVWILNDPFAGGTHLPDVTMVSRTALGFAVSRAHHADVGAVEPGSMPADSRTLDEEGVVIPPTRLDDDTLEALVARMRNPEERRGDFRAQLARAPPGRASARRALRAARPRPGGRGDGRAVRVLGARRARRDRGAPGRPLRGGGRARGGRRGARDPRGRDDRRRRRSRSTSPAPRRSTTGTSTARSPSRAPPRTSSSAA